MSQPSQLELEFDRLWEFLYPDIDLEVEQAIVPNRKFRYDYVHYPAKVAIELNGGIWMEASGHNTGNALIGDYEKNNLAIANGYVCFWISREMLTEEHLGAIARCIKDRRSMG